MLSTLFNEHCAFCRLKPVWPPPCPGLLSFSPRPCEMGERSALCAEGTGRSSWQSSGLGPHCHERVISLPAVIDLVLNPVLDFLCDMIIKGNNAFGNTLSQAGFLYSVVFQTNSIHLNVFINVVSCLLYITCSKLKKIETVHH